MKLTPKEIEITVPWGKIAGKAWGDPNNQYVIAIHGFQDNANSFDKLIPLLPHHYYYVCIDLPCHGKSTSFQNYTFVTFMDFLLTIKFILDHFDKKTYILLGHSYGAQLELIFTQMYPEMVLKLIMLDATYFLPLNPKQCLAEYRTIMERCEKFIQNNRSPPTYTLEEAVDRMRDARFSPISEESARILMERSLIPAGDGKYHISTSQQLKFTIRAAFTVNYECELVKYYPVSCPQLVILADHSKIIRRISKPLLKYLQKNRNYVFTMVPGTHDVHLENPEVVADIVSKFLNKNYSKL